MAGMNNTPEQSRLGQATAYGETHDASLLFPIPRATGRDTLPGEAAGEFLGCDIWHAWELSWLDARGKPHNAVARFIFDCQTPQLIESKSFKLYLGSLVQTRFATRDQLVALLETELGAAAGGKVGVTLFDPAGEHAPAGQALTGTSLDGLDIDVHHYGPPEPKLLTANDRNETEQTLVSRLFRSTCPVTGQPDWASVQIRYRGGRIDPEGLLRYLVSFRHHAGFHEQCVESIFTDLKRRCQPHWLEVYACFTRRGGLDINPWRSSRRPQPPRIAREPRQ